MYERWFGLSARPFRETVDPEVYIPLPSRQAVARRLRYGLEHLGAPVALYGPPGSGKTIEALALAAACGCEAVHVTYPAMPAESLLSYLASELDGERVERGAGTVEAVRRLRHALGERRAQGRRPLLLVDEAHLIEDAAVFHALRLILNFGTRGESDLGIVLIGEPELLLRLPLSWNERLGACCLVGVLTESESAAYVEGRLRASGAARSLFTAGALSALHLLAEGNPRRLGRQADLCLLLAMARELRVVDEEIARVVAESAEDAYLAA